MSGNLPVKEHGFMIRSKTGECWGRPTRGAGGWSIYKTKKNADDAAAGGSHHGWTVVEVTLTIEERIP